MYYYVLGLKGGEPTFACTNQEEMAENILNDNKMNVLLTYDHLINPDTEPGKMEGLAKAFKMVLQFSALSGSRKAHVVRITDDNQPILDKALPKAVANTSNNGGFVLNNN